VDANADCAIRTRVFDLLNNTSSANPWPPPYDAAGAFHNETSRMWHTRPEALEQVLQAQGKDGELIKGYKEQSANTAVTSVWMGQGVSDVHEIDDADAIVRRVNDEACQAISRLRDLVSLDV